MSRFSIEELKSFTSSKLQKYKVDELNELLAAFSSPPIKLKKDKIAAILTLSENELFVRKNAAPSTFRDELNKINASTQKVNEEPTGNESRKIRTVPPDTTYKIGEMRTKLDQAIASQNTANIIQILKNYQGRDKTRLISFAMTKDYLRLIKSTEESEYTPMELVMGLLNDVVDYYDKEMKTPELDKYLIPFLTGVLKGNLTPEQIEELVQQLNSLLESDLISPETIIVASARANHPELTQRFGNGVDIVGVLCQQCEYLLSVADSDLLDYKFNRH